MQIYLVGGAVRDQLLGLPVKDRDWVVVGATPEEMVASGFRPVGRDFPVFLHPETHEEYALARTERKSGKGYKGFTFHTSPDVTLEQDLIRRDLRINAMAMDDTGRLYDPYGGEADLKARRLRHVSEAFSEDPLRILRVARFAARFRPLNFEVAPETLELMRQLSNSDELQHLSAQRVWQEFERALCTPYPSKFLEVLNQCGALKALLPDLSRCDPQQIQQIDDSSLAQSEARFAVLAYQLNTQQGEAALERVAQSLALPKRYLEIAQDLILWGESLSQFTELDATHKLELIEGLKLQRSLQRLSEIASAVELIFHTKVKLIQIKQAITQVNAISPRQLLEEGFSGPTLGAELRRRQIEQLETL